MCDLSSNLRNQRIIAVYDTNYICHFSLTHKFYFILTFYSDFITIICFLDLTQYFSVYIVHIVCTVHLSFYSERTICKISNYMLNMSSSYYYYCYYYLRNDCNPVHNRSLS